MVNEGERAHKYVGSRVYYTGMTRHTTQVWQGKGL